MKLYSSVTSLENIHLVNLIFCVNIEFFQVDNCAQFDF